DGGGIWSNYSKVWDCTVYKNKTLMRVGGGIYALYTNVVNSVIYGNIAESGQYSDGGGVYIVNSSVFNSTVHANKANRGSGIFLQYASAENSIVWGNDIEHIFGGQWGLMGVRNSCFGEATADNGNISADPLFINTSGDMATWDLRLRAESPCIDTGT